METQPLGMYQGDDFAKVATVTIDGVPADLTGFDVSAQIRRNPAAPTVAATLVCAVVDSTIELSLPHDVTETLSGRYVWDLQLTDAGGAVTTIVGGPVYVTAEVTRP